MAWKNVKYLMFIKQKRDKHRACLHGNFTGTFNFLLCIFVASKVMQILSIFNKNTVFSIKHCYFRSSSRGIAILFGTFEASQIIF